MNALCKSSLRQYHRKFKAKAVTPQGVRNIMWDGQSFYVMRHGKKNTLIPKSQWSQDELERAIKGRTETQMEEDFLHMYDASRTGNHKPRNHPIQVPTKPGEPCRG